MKTVYLEQIDSTNNYAKKLIEEGLNEPALIVAKEQTAGRGRQGKNFFSPADTGIYMTVVLQPNTKIDTVVTLTATVACITAECIKKIYGIQTGIKWVNDLYLDGKKVCGILCEAVNDYETMLLKHVIIGIGINMTTMKFPDDIDKSAGSILSSNTELPNEYPREKLPENIEKFTHDTFLYRELITEIASELQKNIPCDFSRYIKYYRNNSIVIGKEVYIVENNVNVYGIAEEIDDIGGLVFREKNGKMRILRSGEISLRVV